MQCPSCDFEAPQVDFGDPLRCPGCGAYYEKALKLKYAPAQPAAVAAPVQKAPAVRLAADHVQVAARGLSGAQPVVVVDVQMRFWSMVLFIVKWTLASIPALLILMLVVAAFVSVAGVWFAALFK